jgi:hypothetical protein
VNATTDKLPTALVLAGGTVRLSSGPVVEAVQTQRWLDRGGLMRARVPQALRAHAH